LQTLVTRFITNAGSSRAGSSVSHRFVSPWFERLARTQTGRSVSLPWGPPRAARFNAPSPTFAATFPFLSSMTRFLLFLFAALTLAAPLRAQNLIEDPTTWTYEAKKTGEGKYDLVFRVQLKSGWHIWSLKPGGDGFQIAPSFTLDKNAAVKSGGAVREAGSGKHTGEMDGVDGIVTYYEGTVTYTLPVRVSSNTTIKGKHEYQVCDDKMCLPPKKKSFSFTITDAGEDTSALVPVTGRDTVAQNTTDTAKGTPTAVSNIPDGPQTTADCNRGIKARYENLTYDEVQTAAVAKRGGALPKLFGTGFLAGLFAVITPCVFAMLPMNVSFFLKRSKTRRKGIWTAIQYSLSILAIFALIGLLVSLLPLNSFNNISTNWVLNLVFFGVFLLFGISFLGAFEINLPSSWATKVDSRANTTSFLGIFFMALTLVIVSFSCTVPFIGGLLFLVQEAGSRVAPVIGFLGFGVGLALPFTLFAIFPTLLNEFGKQGGWLNAVKVTFGIIELALALKFLSNADLAQGWRLLDREIFLVLWIGLAAVLSFYLLGFIRFSHDSELPKNDWGLPYLKVPRLMFSLAALAFMFYLIPGLWGAPLNGMSAFLPPPNTQDFLLDSGGEGNAESRAGQGFAGGAAEASGCYAAEMHIYEPRFFTQFGIQSHFDYFEALAEGKRQGKPVMLDFTGINCANCRKMESQVLSNPAVAARLKEKYVVASLFCDADNQVVLPETERFYSKALQGDVETLGDLNEHVQATRYRANSQPFYFFVDADGHRLVPEGYQYDPSVAKFMAHLDRVEGAHAAAKGAGGGAGNGTARMN